MGKRYVYVVIKKNREEIENELNILGIYENKENAVKCLEDDKNEHFKIIEEHYKVENVYSYELGEMCEMHYDIVLPSDQGKVYRETCWCVKTIELQ